MNHAELLQMCLYAADIESFTKCTFSVCSKTLNPAVDVQEIV